MEACPGPAATVAMVVSRGEEVLLCHAREGPRAGTWLLPSDGLGGGETSETTAVRCVREQAGVVVQLTGLLDVVSLLDPGEGKAASLLVVYGGEERGGELVPASGFDEAAFFSLDALPRELGLRNHRVALERLLSGRPTSWSSPTNP